MLTDNANTGLDFAALTGKVTRAEYEESVLEREGLHFYNLLMANQEEVRKQKMQNAPKEILDAIDAISLTTDSK